MRFFTMTKTVTRNLFGGPATLMYPKKKRDFFPATRGRVENDIHKCIFCGLCAKRCPTYALQVAKDRKEWQIDRLKCCTCNLCVEICPVKSLSMEIQYAAPVSEKWGAIHLEKREPEKTEENPAPKENPKNEPQSTQRI